MLCYTFQRFVGDSVRVFGPDGGPLRGGALCLESRVLLYLAPGAWRKKQMPARGKNAFPCAMNRKRILRGSVVSALLLCVNALQVEDAWGWRSQRWHASRCQSIYSKRMFLYERGEKMGSIHWLPPVYSTDTVTWSPSAARTPLMDPVGMASIYGGTIHTFSPSSFEKYQMS